MYVTAYILLFDRRREKNAHMQNTYFMHKAPEFTPNRSTVRDFVPNRLMQYVHIPSVRT